MSEAVAHKFVHAVGSNDFRDIIWCEYCGYVAFYANDPDSMIDKRRKELPASCIPKPKEEDQ